MNKLSKIVLIIVVILIAAALRGVSIEILPHAAWLRILLGFFTFALILFIWNKGHSSKAKQATVERKLKAPECDNSIDQKKADVVTKDDLLPLESPLIEGKYDSNNDRAKVDTQQVKAVIRELGDNVPDDSYGDQRESVFIKSPAIPRRRVLCYRIGIALTLIGFLLPLVSWGYSKGYSPARGIIGSIPKMQVVVNEFAREDMKDLFPTWSQHARQLAYDRAWWQLQNLTAKELDQLGKHVGQFKTVEEFNRWVEEGAQKDIIDKLAATITIPYRHIVTSGFIIAFLGIGCLLWSCKKRNKGVPSGNSA